MRSVALALIAALSMFLSMNLAMAAPPASARPPIDLVMLADPSPEVAKSAQRWIALFSSVGLDGVQIRADGPAKASASNLAGRRMRPVITSRANWPAARNWCSPAAGSG